MTRWRWLLVVVILGGLIVFPPGGINLTPAQTASDWFNVIASSGTPGSFNANTRTGECRYTAPGGTWQTAIKVPGPSASAIAALPNQRITWEPRIYQGITTGRAYVLSGTLQSISISSGSANFANETISGMPQGPAYSTGGRLAWFSNDVEIGAIELNYQQHSVYREQNPPFGSRLTSCSAVAPAEVSLSTYRTTVNVTVHLTGRYFPISTPVSVTWKGAEIAQAMSDVNGNVFASIKVPAAPAGDYRLGLDAGTTWRPYQTLTLAPRVKLIPDQAERGETIKISLRGFAKKGSVRIRWLRNGTWVEVGWVNTSNTGSGELWIPVPNWAADGANSVRGDGPNARAQTNAVTITGGPGVNLAEDPPSPTPDPHLPATPEPIVDGDPATPAPENGPPQTDGTPQPAETSVDDALANMPDQESPTGSS